MQWDLSALPNLGNRRNTKVTSQSQFLCDRYRVARSAEGCWNKLIGNFDAQKVRAAQKYLEFMPMLGSEGRKKGTD